MFDNGHAKQDFLDKWVNGVEEFRNSLEPFTMEYAAKTCEIPVETLERVAQEIAAADSMCILWAMGITQHIAGIGWVNSHLKFATGNRQLYAAGLRRLSPARPQQRAGRKRHWRDAEQLSWLPGCCTIRQSGSDSKRAGGPASSRTWSG